MAVAAAIQPAARPRHFLDLDRLDRAALRDILDRGRAYKEGRVPGPPQPLAGKAIALIFEKPSTRTRVSFEVGIQQLGGQPVVLEPSGTQIGRGETVADTARVLSRYVDAIMIRTTREEKLLELADYATVPVINGLTDRTHPCQLMADVMTFEGHRGPIAGKTVAWVGDGNNMAASWIHAAVRFGFELRLACPRELTPSGQVLGWAKAEGGKVLVTHDVAKAVTGAHCVVTDTWVSMGDDVGDSERRAKLLTPYQVNAKVMAQADPAAVFLHCLPAYRGKEVSAEVMDGPQSVVWDEAENRLHVQKGILTWCLGL
ncbi:MAG TPA: ornithine carbamoyltransferase [Kiloniellales bacterium]|nr:ornithine carbamoyltransferase [Kiloniellales bacterium]